MDSKNFACGPPQVTRHTTEKSGCYPRMAIQGGTSHPTEFINSPLAPSIAVLPIVVLSNLNVNYVRFLQFHTLTGCWRKVSLPVTDLRLEVGPDGSGL
jgi:hypothetical protein